MVAVISGNGTGLERSSAFVLGSRGQLGQAGLGRAGDNVFVNAATGGLTIQNLDEMLMGLGPDARIARTYNSLGTLNDDNGDNWRASVSRRVYGLTGTVNTAGSTITRTDWDGSETVYSWDTTKSAYVSKEGTGAYDTLTFAGSTWTWKDGNSRVTELYDNNNSGRITSSADTDGNALSFSYNGGGLVSRVTTADGHYTDLTYSGTNLTQLTTSYRETSGGTLKTLTRVRYGYDGSNRLTTVTVDLTPNDNSVSDNVKYVTTYTYDGTSKRVASITQTDGSSLAIAYTLVGSDYRVSSLTQTSATSVTRVTSFSHNTSTRTTTITDPSSQVTTLTYDTSGQLLTIVAPAAASGGTAQTSTFTYNANGDVLTTVDPSGRTITYDYDSNGNAISQRDTAGNVVTRTFGSNNELLTETQYLVPDPDGGTLTATVPVTTRYAYDSENHPRFVVSAEGYVTEFVYSAAGQQTSAIQYAGNTYDISALGVTATISESTLASWASGISDKTTFKRTDTTYNFRGDIATVTSFGKTTTAGAGDTSATTEITKLTYVYDQAGNLLSRQLDGASTSETYVYDGLNRVTSAVDNRGLTTTVTFTDASSVTTVATSGSGVATITATSTYNLAGELISYAQSASGMTTATTTYRYDALGRLRGVTDALGVKSYILYDRVGRMVAQIDGDGSLSEFGYNADNLLVKTVRYKTLVSSTLLTQLDTNVAGFTYELSAYRPSSDAADIWEWRIYDSSQRLIETIDGAGAASVFEYDGASRLVKTTAYAGLIASGTVSGYKTTAPTSLATPTADSANDRISRLFYDADGRLTGTLDAEGYLTKVIYDSAGQQVETIAYSGVTSTTYRASGTYAQLLGSLTVNNATDIHHWSVYDQRGLLRAEIDGEGNLTRYHYTALGYLDQVIVGQKLSSTELTTVLSTRPTLSTLPSAAGGTLLETTAYTRDLYGKVLTEVRTLTGGSTETDTYTYDTYGRLLKLVTLSGASDTRTATWRYDNFGRLTGQLSGEGSAALAALGGSPTQPQIDDIYARWGTQYAYDADDRLISKVESNGTDAAGLKTLYYYDVDGQLTHTINALGEAIEYRYDAVGRRTDVIVYGTRIGSTPLATLTGGLVNTTLTSAITTITNSTLDSRTQLAYNATSTVSASTDAEGAVTTYSYNAFTDLTAQLDPISSGVTHQVSRAYDRKGLLLSSTVDAAGLNIITSATYDAFGRAITTTDPDGKVRSTSYDRAGRVLTTTDPLSGVTTYTYDGRGAVLTIKDRVNATATTTFAYTAFNRTVTMTTPEGLATTTNNNAYGQTLTVTDGASRTVTFTYDKDGGLKTETDGLSNQIQNSYDKAGRLSFTLDQRGAKTSFTYDAANRVLTRKVDDGALNLTTTYEWDAKGQQTKVTDGAGRITTVAFDRNGRTTTVTADPAGLALVTKYEYDQIGRSTKVTEAFGSAAARITQYNYDKAGRLTSTQVNPAGLNLTTTYAYDKRGNVIARTDAAGNKTRFVYDNDNRLIWTVDAAGDVTKTSYDAEGRVVTTQGYANMVAAATLTSWGTTPLTETMVTTAVSTSSSDHKINYAYNKDGQVRFVADGLGRPTEYIYDNSGNVIRQIQYNGAITPATWSATDIASAISAAGLASNTGTRTTRAVFDAAGRQAYGIDATGAVTAFSYDAVGNVIKAVQYAVLYTTSGDPAASAMATWVTTNANATNDRVSRTVYDGAGRAVYSVDAEGYVSEVQYDAAGNVTKEIRYAAAYSVSDGVTKASLASLIGTLPGTAVVTQYAYDAAGRLTDVTDALGSVTRRVMDALGQVTDLTRAYGTGDAATIHSVFDAAGRVTSRTQGYGVAEASTSSFAYDGMGRVLVTTNGRGYTTTRSYDAAGQVLTETVQLNASQTAVTTNQYDAFGNLVKVTDPRGNAGYFYYNALNQLTRQVDPETYVTDTTYSLGGQALTVKRFYNKATTGLGSVTTPPSDPTSHSKDATTTIERDRLDRVTKVTDAEGYYEQFTLNAFGDRATVTNKLGGSTTNLFDKRGLLTQETLPAGSTKYDGTVLSTTIVNKYEYDARGNRTKAIEADNVSLDKRTTSFVYDKLDHLTQEIGDAVTVTGQDLTTAYSVTPTKTITYDRRGNIIASSAESGATTFYYYDDLDRKIGQIDAAGTLSTWTYDAANNVTAARVYGDALVLPTNPNGSAAQIWRLYDLALGRPPEAGEVTSWVWRLNNLYPTTAVTSPWPTLDGHYDYNGVNAGALEAICTEIIGDSGVASHLGTSNNTTFITALYQYGFARAPTTNELSIWQTNLASGWTKGGMLGFFSEHSDHRARVTAYGRADGIPYGDTQAHPTDPNGSVTQIWRLYDLALGRPPEAGEVTSWVWRLNNLYPTTPVTSAWPTLDGHYDSNGVNAGALEAICTEIIGDSGVASRLGTSNNTTFITALYQYGFGRAPTTNELSIWQTNLASGWTKGGMLGFFSEHSDHRARVTAIIAQSAAGGAAPTPIDPSNYRETTYVYDRNNRRISASVANLRTAAWNGTSLATSVATVTTQLTYDAMGNVVQETDGLGNSVFHFYDKRGRELARVDQENYLTSYTLDAEGNVTKEERFATRITGTVTVSSDPATLRSGVVSGTLAANNRVTDFTYDKVGQRLTETRTGVVSYSINSSTGLLSTDATSAAITYTYNGLGEVTRRTEANGDYTDYTYDTVGRQTAATDSAFTDYTAASVQHRVDTFYDGLNNVTRMREGKVATDSAIDRVTMFAYGAGGRLASTTDALTNTRTYAYDADGHVVKEGYTRLKADGTTTLTEAVAYRYDAMGRTVLQASASYNSGTNTWTFGDKTHIRYDAYGEVTGKGITAGSVKTPVYQETFDYDAGGRMWRSNTGDGSYRLYMYDAAGHMTLAVSSTATDLSIYGAIETAISGLGSTNITGGAFLAGIAPTIIAYDKRGQNIETRETFRELNQNATTPTTNDTALISHKRAYNAFGEVIQETDARNFITDFSYNALGKLIKKESPYVKYTLENGTIVNDTANTDRPTENYYYDLSGRLIGVKDANGNLNSRALMAGSGHGDEEAIVTAEFRAGANDSTRSGTYTTGVDLFGDARKLTNELGYIETRDYDMSGQLITLTRPTRAATSTTLVEHYTYDSLGHRLTHWNSQLGTNNREKTDYDLQGRIVRSESFGDDFTIVGGVAVYSGDATTYSYAWDATLATTGLTATPYGGVVTTTTHVSGRTSTDSTDYFGREVDHVNYGGYDYAFTFDKAGRLIQKTSNFGQKLDYTYFNTGNLATLTDHLGVTGAWVSQAVYAYDQSGNRTSEKFTDTVYSTYRYIDGETHQWVEEDTSGLYVHQDAQVTYDGLNRMITYTDTGSVGGTVTASYEYDAAGNMRHAATTYPLLIGSGTATQDYWYKYDSMNRFVTTKGVFTGTRGSGSISRGTQGLDIAYDAAGQRVSATNSPTTTTSHREDYVYSEDGYLSQVKMADATWNGTAWVWPGSATLRATDTRDAMGRVTTHAEYKSDGTSLAYSRTATYNNRSLVTADSTVLKQADGKWFYADTSYVYTAQNTPGTGAFVYQGGAVVSQTTTSHTTNASGGSYTNKPTTSTTNSYFWLDSAHLSLISYKPDTSQSTTFTSTFHYDTRERITSVDIADGRPRTVKFSLNADNQVLERIETSAASTNPRDVYYYFAGVKVGDNSNNGTSETDYATAIANRSVVSGTGAFRFGATSGTQFADFDQSYQAVNPNGTSPTNTTYTVTEGETLQSVAAAVWGDASLWYLIADANGLTSVDGLATGMSLVIPNKVTNVHNTSETFRPYDPNKAIGDTSPTTPKPPPKKGCGVLGAIIMVVIAVVVVAITKRLDLAAKILTALETVGVPAAVATVAAPIVATATAAAAGSIASQGVGLAIGAIDKFSWNAVAIAALTASVSGGGSADSLGTAKEVIQSVVRGAVANAVVQGVAVAVGWQDRFDWTGVAVAGVIGGVSDYVGAKLPAGITGVSRDLVTGLAAGAAGAAARSLIEGSDFGDNLVAALPDILGNTIGNMIAGGLAAKSLDEKNQVGGKTQSNSEAAATRANDSDYSGGGRIFGSGIRRAFGGGDLGGGGLIPARWIQEGEQALETDGDTTVEQLVVVGERDHHFDLLVDALRKLQFGESAHQFGLFLRHGNHNPRVIGEENGTWPMGVHRYTPSKERVEQGRRDQTAFRAGTYRGPPAPAWQPRAQTWLDRNVLNPLGSPLTGWYGGQEAFVAKTAEGIDFLLEHPQEALAAAGEGLQDLNQYAYEVQTYQRSPVVDIVRGGWNLGRDYAGNVGQAWREGGWNAASYVAVRDLTEGAFNVGTLAGPLAEARGAALAADSTKVLTGRASGIALAAESAGGVRSTIIGNIADSQAARQSSNFGAYAAREAQTLGGYVADDFTMMTIPKGSVVYGGNPMSAWFTNGATVDGSGLSQKALWNSLQVMPNKDFGPRMSVNAYEVTKDTRVPVGGALKNTTWGDGGGWQFYFNQSNASHVLKQIENKRLH